MEEYEGMDDEEREEGDKEEVEEEEGEEEGTMPAFPLGAGCGEEKKSSRAPPTKEHGKPCSHNLRLKSRGTCAPVEGQKK